MADKDQQVIPTYDKAQDGEIVDIGSVKFLEQLKGNPLETIYEVGTGVLKRYLEDKVEGVKSFGRILKARKSGECLRQFVSELKNLQEEGKIETDAEIAEKEHAKKSLIDLFEVMDDNPEEDRLKAIKAIFFLMIKQDKASQEDALLYGIFQIVKKLSSDQLMLLKTIYGLNPKLVREAKASNAAGSRSIAKSQWIQRVANERGHGIVELILKDLEYLIDLRLVPGNLNAETYGMLDIANYVPTKLGIKLCELLEEYETMIN